MARSSKKRVQLHTQHNRTIGFHAKTLFLFTRSDLKTVVFPQAVFALAIAMSKARFTDYLKPPQLDIGNAALRLGLMFIWIFLHLLLGDISNQRLLGSVLEDKINKPWRPMPSGRLTENEAKSLLKAVVLAAIGFSLLFNSSMPSFTLITMFWLYNDLEGNAAGPWQRNAFNAAGLTCFSWGAVTVLLGDQINEESDKIIRKWYFLMAVVITTTIHAQDFPDVVGDKARGRRTLPLIYGESLSRWSMAVFVTFWSFACPAFWNITAWDIRFLYVCFGLAISLLTTLQCGEQCDKWVWRLWCLWAATLYLLPLFSPVVL
ncbi:UbiA prenyltransferase family-domain-containing protein [Jackrogersella minutella]|nr:UbiA prenyltransferase family-domain-containing protein [Jackrogersella minutella]